MTTIDDLEGLVTRLRDRTGAAERALADARAERDAAEGEAAELRRRLDRIVSFLGVKHDVQGHSAAWAATVVRIARGDLDAAGGDPTR